MSDLKSNHAPVAALELVEQASEARGGAGDAPIDPHLELAKEIAKRTELEQQLAARAEAAEELAVQVDNLTVNAMWVKEQLADRDDLRERLEKAHKNLAFESRHLRRWADESRKGGWSTHQVEPMLFRADQIDAFLASERARGGGDTPNPAHPATDSR